MHMTAQWYVVFDMLCIVQYNNLLVTWSNIGRFCCLVLTSLGHTFLTYEGFHIIQPRHPFIMWCT